MKMKFLKQYLLFLILTSLFACAHSTQSKVQQKNYESAQLTAIPHLEVQKLIVMPNPKGHPEFIDAIDQAKSSIHLSMFHLTDTEAIDALIKARKRGVEVKVILDGKSLLSSKYKVYFNSLLDNHIDVIKSSNEFSIMHAKTMVVDHKLAMVTAINLTLSFADSRDFGIVTSDEGVVNELERVFSIDFKNANEETTSFIEIQNPYLVFSPNNSEERLINLIQSAKKSIKLQVENISDREVMDALERMANKGVDVEVIVPLCDKNPNPLFNVRHIKRMLQHKVNARVMPSPSSPEKPYIHSKMILVDQQYVYVGSINFSFNSIVKAREIGIIFENKKIGDEINQYFDKDWKTSINLPDDTSTVQCKEF